MFTKDGKFVGNYSVGLDIGTESVGWAVVDDSMNLVKRHGRHLWGSRLFDKAESAKERRAKRSLRRRLQRRRVRLFELRALFADFINDDLFFERLDESFLQKNDRSQQNRDILFYNNEISILDNENKQIKTITNDQQHFEEFPTIFHLRESLIKEPNKQFDPKLIYLAIHNILKYRGNFLYENLNLNAENSANNLKDEFYKVLDEVTDEYAALIGEGGADDIENEENNFFKEINCDAVKEQLLETVMCDKSLKEKQKEVEILLPKYKEQTKIFVAMLLGNSFDYSKFFNTDDDTKSEDKSTTKLAFSDDVEDKITNSGEYVEFLSACQRLYSIFTFMRLMQNKKYISEIMVERYKIYNEQLHALKDVFRECFSKEEYKAFFRDLNPSSKVNYARFTEGEINCFLQEKKNKSPLENLQNEIKKKLNSLNIEKVSLELAKKINRLKTDIENKELFIKPRNHTNGVFPMQANRIELETILQNQSKYYPELAKDSELYKKTLRLFDFRIDYFVGPLASNPKNKDSNFGWLERNIGYENTTITPFNYNEVIDLEKTQSKFIERMTGNCTYILGEKALPKNSIYYCWFNVINEVSNLRVSVNGGKYQPISKFEIAGKPVVDYIFDRLKETNTYKKKDLICLLQKEYTNVDVKFANGESLISNLKPYRDFVRIFGVVNDKNIKTIEAIIRDITIFGENKESLENRLRNEYHELTDRQIKDIRALNYTGWGNLSQKLIYGITAQNEEDRSKTILHLMGEKLVNFVAIYSEPKYKFKEQVEKLWAENNKSIREQIKELTASTEVKRGINQAFLIVKELEHVMGKTPKNIFIEFARETQEKNRTSSRQKKLAEQYDKIKQQHEDLYNEIVSRVDVKALKDETLKDRFSEEKFYLYFLQGGKCMYTGESLDLNKLEQYDVDHIVPQSIIKDDSIDNKALVVKNANMHKSNSLVVPEEYRNKMKGYWWRLKEAELISADKYTRLTRKELTDNDLGHFIKRQLVETRQITKNTAMLLNEYFKQKGENVGIYPIKAGINSLFRKRFGYPKGEAARALNDLHHAKDAYISVFMGTYLLNNFNLDVIENRHTTDMYHRYYLLGQDNRNNETDIEKKQNKYRKYGIVFYYMNKTNSKWDKTDNSMMVDDALKIFDNNYYKVDCYVSRKTEISDSGKLYKETLFKNEANRVKFGEKERELISIGKQNDNTYFDTNKYGGYTSMQFSKFAVVSYSNKKGNTEYRFVGIPRLYTLKTGDLDINNYFKAQKLNDAKIICYIPKYQLVEDSGLRLIYIAGERAKYTAHQFIINKENKILNTFIYYIYKYGVDFDKWLNDNDYVSWNENTTLQEVEKFINDNFEKFSKYYLNHFKKYYPQDSTYETIKRLLEQANNDYNIVEKVKLIPQLLNITANNASTGNLKQYNLIINKATQSFDFNYYNEDGERKSLAKDSGTITKSFSLGNAYLIYNSATGIYSKKKKIIEG